MTATLNLATPADAERVLGMVAAYHTFEGIKTDAADREAAVAPLLDGSPHGAIWLIGPKMSPVGYICISFGWSIELGGMDGFIDEFYIREAVRGRGMGTEVLAALLPTLRDADVKAVHLEVEPTNRRAHDLYFRSGFRLRDGFHLMTWQA